MNLYFKQMMKITLLLVLSILCLATYAQNSRLDNVTITTQKLPMISICQLARAVIWACRLVKIEHF